MRTNRVSHSVQQYFQGEPVEISLQFITDEFMASIGTVVEKVLSRLDRIFLLNSLMTILREIILNAGKANAKRVFFEKSGLVIENQEDYHSGMLKFKDIVSDFEFLKGDILASPYRIEIKIIPDPRGIKFEVTNNIKIKPSEAERIRFRMQKAAECTTFAEAFDKVYDPTEGAGLGIILIILLLRNDGIDVSNFSVITGEDFVKTVLFIPLELKKPEITHEIKMKLLTEIDTLPPIPENIIELQKLCEITDISIETLASKITIDPAITADLLRMSNSAGFISGRRIESIPDAIIIIGLKNLRQMVTVSATRKILDKRYKRFESIWEHCNRTAALARGLAIQLNLIRHLDSVFIAGLLHDIGKIVLLSTDQGLVDQISEIVKDHKIKTSAVIEEISIGISHAEIGSLLARKWNFPDDLIECIRYHHSPLDSGPLHRDIVMIIYLANILARCDKFPLDPGLIEAEVLERFHLDSASVVSDLNQMLLKIEY